ncbi:hypothetical protein [Pseudomonas cichorii]|uniref:hypothetical protein n=1 Tax=Pseudomonas cichorii TaxID=36746 RepID=UPI00190FD15C|nr:hypothetical protein [Pseudomonas cichorii]
MSVFSGKSKSARIVAEPAGGRDLDFKKANTHLQRSPLQPCAPNLRQNTRQRPEPFCKRPHLKQYDDDSCTGTEPANKANKKSKQKNISMLF